MEDAIIIAESYDSLLHEILPAVNRPLAARAFERPQIRGAIPQGGPMPMEIDAVATRRAPLTSAERERLAKIGACFYCRQVGHMLNACPNLNRNNRPRRIAQVDRLEEEGIDLDSENEDSQ